MSSEHAKFYERNPQRKLNKDGSLVPVSAAESSRIQFWRNDALEAAAKIADRYNAIACAADIRALIKDTPT